MKWNPRNQKIAPGLAVLGTALACLSAHSAPTSPPGPNVTVVNTQTNPVPVSVLNFPTGTNTVQVSSSTNAPVLVRDVDKSVRDTFSVSHSFALTNGVTFKEDDLLTPPPGKRAVIETVAVTAFVGPGQTPLALISAGGNPFALLLTPQGRLDSKDLYVGTFPIRLYSKEPVVVSLSRDPAAGLATTGFSISGYFEDAP